MPRSIPSLQLHQNRSTKNRVLRAAAKLFANNGFRGTSVRQIANRAKVNEVTIFRLFNSKRGLYKEVLESKLKETRPLGIPAELKLQDENIFRALAHDLQQAFDPEFIRLMFFAALENPEDVRKSVSPQLDQYYSILADYLQTRINCGAIREADPRIMAKALVALLVYDRISSDFSFGAPPSTETPQAQTGSLLEIWLHGVTRQQIEAVAPVVNELSQ
ncbi:MAG: TetR/AcrR family transcriptional regulator [Terriglobales bacterium]